MTYRAIEQLNRAEGLVGVIASRDWPSEQHAPVKPGYFPQV